MSISRDTITVITLTRKRPHLIKRVILSVQNQKCDAHLIHIILIDDCSRTKVLFVKFYNLPHNVYWKFCPRDFTDRSGPARVAKLRNYGIDISNTEWISFLDDDNEYEPNHLSSLLLCAKRTGCPAVHSYRKLYHQDGTPYLVKRMPCRRSKKEGEKMYKYLYDKGIFEQGSNIMRDSIVPLESSDSVRVVDTGEWLFKRSLLVQNPFCEEYSYDDWRNWIHEDDKLTETLARKKVPIACTGIPTLKYYYGGYSNTFDKDTLFTDVWRF